MIAPIADRNGNRNGNRIELHYDSDHRIASISDSRGRVTTFARHPDSDNVTSMTDPAGRVHAYAYSPDDDDELVAYTDPAGDTTSYEDLTNDRVGIVDAPGQPHDPGFPALRPGPGRPQAGVADPRHRPRRRHRPHDQLRLPRRLHRRHGPERQRHDLPLRRQRRR